jgi:hypothetical protein
VTIFSSPAHSLPTNAGKRDRTFVDQIAANAEPGAARAVLVEDFLTQFIIFSRPMEYPNQVTKPANG